MVVSTLAKLGEPVSANTWICTLVNGLKATFEETRKGVMFGRPGFDTVLAVKILLSTKKLFLQQALTKTKAKTLKKKIALHLRLLITRIYRVTTAASKDIFSLTAVRKNATSNKAHNPKVSRPFPLKAKEERTRAIVKAKERQIKASKETIVSLTTGGHRRTRLLTLDSMGATLMAKDINSPGTLIKDNNSHPHMAKVTHMATAKAKAVDEDGPVETSPATTLVLMLTCTKNLQSTKILIRSPNGPILHLSDGPRNTKISVSFSSTMPTLRRSLLLPPLTNFSHLTTLHQL